MATNSSNVENKVRAVVVSAVLLLVILLSVMAYQLISIAVKKKEEARLNEQIAIYEQMIAEGRNDVEMYSQRWWIEQRAFELNYRYQDDINLGKK